MAVIGRVHGKVALITDASFGIGNACARLLANEGACVAVTGTQDGVGWDLAGEIEQADGQVGYWHLDVTDESQVREVMDSVRSRFGPISVLVNNLAISERPLRCTSGIEEEWDRLMAVNVNGVYYCSKYALIQMAQAGSGSIINVAPSSDIVGAPAISALVAVRSSMRQAPALTPVCIRVNSVYLGNLETDSLGIPQQAYTCGQTLFDWNSQRTVESIKDIALGVLYLASDDSEQMMRTELIIDDRYAGRQQ
jgi:NAD(P)-dependent dehydrogenase (short-subunit alcohol dehydrogenase family)